MSGGQKRILHQEAHELAGDKEAVAMLQAGPLPRRCPKRAGGPAGITRLVPLILASLAGLALGGACVRRGVPQAPREQPTFAHVERLLYPYRVTLTVDGHRQLGALIQVTQDSELRAGACYHYLRTSL